ncbi:hypothetical protein ASPFODRAFT_47761 [Aspergillus luchuensis CBS 106.47]|nr:hypothetical protein ASPFODRAFT_47761 [Aspergillus luchuensis CBS 106.47]BCS14468.1 hypothetical protein ALUC_61024A [Aspergillus luchuensis]
MDSALAIIDFLYIRRTRWGPDDISPTTIHWVGMALFTLAEDLDNSDHCSAFTELCVTSCALSRNWTLMKVILRMLQVSPQKNEITLPPKTYALSVDFQKIGGWGPSRPVLQPFSEFQFVVGDGRGSYI